MTIFFFALSQKRENIDDYSITVVRVLTEKNSTEVVGNLNADVRGTINLTEVMNFPLTTITVKELLWGGWQEQEMKLLYQLVALL